MTVKHWILETARYGLKDDRVAPFHCFPIFFILLGGLAMWVAPHLIPLPLDVDLNVGRHYSGNYGSIEYQVWLGMAIICPLMVFFSYWLPEHTTNTRYFSIWIRWAGDAGCLFAMLSLDVETFKILSDTTLFRNILFLCVIAFVGAMLVRDTVLIVASDRLAKKIEARKREGQD